MKIDRLRIDNEEKLKEDDSGRTLHSINDKLDELLKTNKDLLDEQKKEDKIKDLLKDKKEAEDKDKSTKEKRDKLDSLSTPDYPSDKNGGFVGFKKPEVTNKIFNEVFAKSLGPFSGFMAEMWRKFSPGSILVGLANTIFKSKEGEEGFVQRELKRFSEFRKILFSKLSSKGVIRKSLREVRKFSRNLLREGLEYGEEDGFGKILLKGIAKTVKRIFTGFIRKFAKVAIEGAASVLDIAVLLAPLWNFVRVFLYNWTKNNPLLHKLVVYLDHIITPFNDFFDDIVNLVEDSLFKWSDLGKDFRASMDDLFKIFKGIFAPLTAIIKGSYDYFKTDLEDKLKLELLKLKDSMIKGIIWALNGLIDLPSLVSKGMDSALKSFHKLFHKDLPDIVSNTEKESKSIKSESDKFLKNLSNNLSDIWDSIVQSIKDFPSNAVKWANDFTKNMSTIIPNIFDAIVQSIKDFPKNVKNWAEQSVKGAASLFNLKKDVKELKSEQGSTEKQIGTLQGKTGGKGLYSSIANQMDKQVPDNLMTGRGEKPAPVTATKYSDVTSAVGTSNPSPVQLVKHFEGNKGGYAAIGGEKGGDAGGASYGAYQFASKTGSLKEFLVWSGYDKQFEGLQPGTSGYDQKWVSLSNSDPKFNQLQDQYAQISYFDPITKSLKSSLGIDISSRSSGLQALAYSSAIQYGTGGADKIFRNALAGKNVSAMTDSQIIQAVNDYKSATASQNFESSGAVTAQKQVARYSQESQMELAMAGDVNKSPNNTNNVINPIDNPSTSKLPAGSVDSEFGGALNNLSRIMNSGYKSAKYGYSSQGRLPSTNGITDVNGNAIVKEQQSSNQALTAIATNTSPSTADDGFDDTPFDIELIKQNMGVS